MAKQLRLSQCMIVKDEEDNIRQALSWGQKISCEQIVVDTGSTDNTAAIAESMGAKVYHYEWNNDFAAAKNYAISQATGNWIAFLDADEYFLLDDVPKLKKILVSMNSSPAYKNIEIIRCALHNVNDEGKVFSTMKQDRIFRNNSQIRFEHKIHESLCHKSGKKMTAADLGMDIPIYHTGYSETAYKKQNKSERNVEIIRGELDQDPGNYDNWAYLGDSLLIVGEVEEAKKAYRKVLDHPEAEMKLELRLNAAANLIRYSLQDPSFLSGDMDSIYEKYLAMGQEQPDIEYWTGMYMFKEERFKEASVHLEKALDILKSYVTTFTLYIVGSLDLAYSLLADCYLNMDEKAEAVKNITLSLKVNRFQEKAASALLALFLGAGEPADGVTGFLQKLYDFTSTKDKLFLIKEAKKSGYTELLDRLYTFLTEDEQHFLYTGSSEEGIPDLAEILKEYPAVACRNRIDRQFLTDLYWAKNHSEEEILKGMKAVLEGWKKEQPVIYQKITGFYTSYPYWGSLLPDQEEYTAFLSRVKMVKEQEEHIVGLYQNLMDYRSKTVLLAVLENWLKLELRPLEEIKEAAGSCYDLDIIASARDEVLLDVEAKIGDSVKAFAEQYGDTYQHIYCCEEREHFQRFLKDNTRKYPRLTVMEAFIPEELPEDVSILRIDARERTKEILTAYGELIKRNLPKIIVYNYYSYEDIFKVPELVRAYRTDYKFYLRYFGEDLIPTNYILYAVPPAQSVE